MLKAFKWPQINLAEQAFKNSIEDAPNPPNSGLSVFLNGEKIGETQLAATESEGLSKEMTGEIIFHHSIIAPGLIDNHPPCQNVSGFEPSPLLVPDSLYQIFLFYLYQVMGKTDGVGIVKIESKIKHPESGGNYAALMAAYMYDKGQGSKYGPVQNIIARHEAGLEKFKQLDAECFPIKRPRPSKAK